MRSNYKKLGKYIESINERNKDLEVDRLLGVSIQKVLMPSIANTVGTDMSRYKIIRKKQFAYGPVTSRNGDKISVALLLDFENAIISQAYTVFEIIDHEELDPEYLMMWFRRPEFDRYARFKSHGSARETFDWDEMCDVELPVPSIEKQRAIVKEYKTVVNRIKLNEQLNQKLEETAQALYRHWFVDFEFPISTEYAASVGKPELEGLPYKSSGGEMAWNEELEKEIPEGWIVESLKNVCDKISSGATPKGGKESYLKSGIPLIRSMNVYDFNFEHENLAFINDVQANKLNNVALHVNDILFNITGASVARCCMVPNEILPGRINQHIMIVRPKKELYLNHYILCNLCSTDSKKELVGVSESGSTRQAITKGDLEEFRILLPKHEVLKSFEGILSQIFKRKNNYREESLLLSSLKGLILAKMARNQTKTHIVIA